MEGRGRECRCGRLQLSLCVLLAFIIVLVEQKYSEYIFLDEERRQQCTLKVSLTRRSAPLRDFTSMKYP